VNAYEVKAQLIGSLANNLAPSVSGSLYSLVVAAVLRDSLCVVSLLLCVPCVADCCILYSVCKVERFVLTIIKRRLLLLLNVVKVLKFFLHINQEAIRQQKLYKQQTCPSIECANNHSPERSR